MADMASVIVPKSDQMNSDDLIAGPRTICIREVRVAESGEQRVSIFYNGDNNKPYKPCKSMCRILVDAWQGDSSTYVGRSMTLYRDPKVTWGGMEVGGIRISHMSHIDRDKTLALTATKGKKAIHTVRVLQVNAPPQQQEKRKQTMPEWLATLDADLLAAGSEDDVHERMQAKDVQDCFSSDKVKSDIKARINEMAKKHLDRFMEDAEMFPGDLPNADSAA